VALNETALSCFSRAGLAVLSTCAAVMFFAPPASAATLTIDIDGSAESSGAVTDWSGLIDCHGPPLTGKCSASFSQQAVQLVLTVDPGPFSAFAGWSGLGGEIGIPEDNCRRLQNPCMVWLSNDKTLTATFRGGPPWEEPECFLEPWECEEELGSGPGAEQAPSPADESDLSAVPPERPIPAFAISSPTSRRRSFERCDRGDIHRADRCQRKKGGVRRACRRQKGTAKRRCVRRVTRKLGRLEMRRARAAPLVARR
jgi:hypothetical protein